MNINEVWDSQYESNNDTALKDVNLFKLESNALIKKINEYIEKTRKKEITILELGSGTGYLARIIIDAFANVKINYTGVDFSANACEIAKKRELKNSTFIQNDFDSFLKTDNNKYDIILSQRSIMAVMKEDEQNSILRLIKQKIDGIGLFSECTVEGLENLNSLRSGLGIDELEKVWHSKYLDKKQLDKYFVNYEIEDFSSIYYLVTRVIYPYFEEPKHNTPLADFAASLKQTGNFSFLKLIIVKI